MKKQINFLAAAVTLLVALNLTGCVVLHDEDAYRYENGDRVSPDGSIRYVGWCNAHPQNVHCLSQSSVPPA